MLTGFALNIKLLQMLPVQLVVFHTPVKREANAVRQCDGSLCPQKQSPGVAALRQQPLVFTQVQGAA